MTVIDDDMTEVGAPKLPEAKNPKTESEGEEVKIPVTDPMEMMRIAIADLPKKLQKMVRKEVDSALDERLDLSGDDDK